MTSLRELFVKVDIQDSATGPLNNINNLVNNITQAFQHMGASTNTSLNGFQHINSQVIQLTNNLNQSTHQITNLNNRLNTAENEMQGLRVESQRMENELHGAQTEMGLLRNRLDQAEHDAQQLRQEMQQMAQNANKAKSSMGGLGSTLRGMVGLVGSVFAVHQIKDFAMSGIEVAAGMQALNSQFSQVFGEMSTTAETNLNKIANDTSILPERLKGSFVQMAAFAKTTGADTASAMSLAERATMAAADSAAFLDRDLGSVTENLQSLLKGNFENDSALGISVTETTRNTAALDLYGKKFKDLGEQQKQLTLLKMVEDGNKLSGALGQSAREGSGFENVVGNLKSSWDALKGTMMDSMLPTVIDGLQGLTQKISSVDAAALGESLKSGFEQVKSIAVPTFETLKTGFGWLIDNKDAVISVGAGLTAGFAAFNGIQTGMKIFDTFKDVGGMAGMFAKFTNPIGIAVVAIGGLVAAGIYLYRNWDTVKEKAGILKDNLASAWQQIKDNTSNAIQPVIGFFGNLKDGIMNTWTGIKDGVNNAVTQVGGFFTGLKEKAFGLWETIKQNPMLLSVVGPIGMVVGAGMTLYQNWETIRTKAGELWSTVTEKFAGIKQSVSDFIQPALGWFDSLMGKWNDFKSAISNFSMPEWMSSAGSMVSGAIGKVKGLVDGSHATGLANIEKNGYIAELHKNEAVLTAPQANMMRSAGILSANGDGTPNLDFSSLKTESSMIQQATNDVPPMLNQTILPTALNQTVTKESSMIQPLFEPTFNPMIQSNVEQPVLDKLTPQVLAVPNVQVSQQQSAPNINVSLNVPLSVNGTSDGIDYNKVVALIRDRVPNMVRQVVSDIIDEDLTVI